MIHHDGQYFPEITHDAPVANGSRPVDCLTPPGNDMLLRVFRVENTGMTLRTNVGIRDGVVALLSRLEIAVAGRLASKRPCFCRPQRNEADPGACGVVIVAEEARHVVVVRGASVHTSIKIRREERHERSVGRVFVALHSEGVIAQD